MQLALSVLFGAGFGVSAGLLLIGGGRIAGISGAISGLLQPSSEGADFRITFLSGLVIAGAIAMLVAPDTMPVAQLATSPRLLLGGALLGFGAYLASGCTSGHGVCGVGRLSPRSIVAVSTFFAASALTLLVMRIGS